jgi:1-acyl-sn-glycerol-3-phosphate acyltransferase
MIKSSLLALNHNFRNLWLSQVVASLGDRLTQIGLLTIMLFVYKDEGSKTALLTFSTLLPFTLFGAVFGALADRFSRKKLMLASDAGRSVLVGLLPVIWASTHSITAIMALVFILGTLSSLGNSAKQSIVTNIIPKDRLIEGNSLLMSTGLVTTLIGTFVAGTLFKFSGTTIGFYINSATYILSILCILGITHARVTSTEKAPAPLPEAKGIVSVILYDLREGMRFIARHRVITNLIILHCTFGVISSFVYILVLNYSAKSLNQSPLGLGILLACAGVGMLCGAGILLLRKDRVNFNRALYLSFLIIGVFCCAFLLRPSFVPAAFILFCAGIGSALFTVTQDTIMQRIVPEELKAKIFSAQGAVSNAVFLCSLLLVGWLIKFLPAINLFACVGALALLASVVIFVTTVDWQYVLFQASMSVALRLFVNFRVSGAQNIPKKRKVIFAGNHTSLLDGAALVAAYPRRICFLVAQESFKTFPWGGVMSWLGYLKIDRTGFNKETIKQAIGILRSGHAIGIFPEGRITPDGQLTKGREGVALIARLADADIIPFAIEGAFESWPSRKKLPKRFPVELRFGKPIDISQFQEKTELTKDVMAEIAKVKLALERDGYLRVEPRELISHLINIG